MNIRSIIIFSFMWIPIFLFSQNKEIRKISGIVIDNESNEVLIGANILIKGTEVGTTSDIDGKFELEIPKNENVILYISYTCGGIEVKTKNNKSYYRINLFERPSKLMLDLNYGLTFLTTQRNDAKSSFKIGINYEPSGKYRFRWSTGISYNNINTNYKNLNFGSLEIPFHLKFNKYNWFLKSGVNLNYVIHQNFKEVNLNKFIPSLYSEIGYQLFYKLNVHLSFQYYFLKINNENFNLINPTIGISFTL